MVTVLDPVDEGEEQGEVDKVEEGEVVGKRAGGAIARTSKYCRPLVSCISSTRICLNFLRAKAIGSLKRVSK